MARKFLYIVAAAILLILAAAFAYRLFGTDLMRMAMVPSTAFEKQAPKSVSAYDGPALWLARPDIIKNNAALWTPKEYAATTQSGAAIFYVHPTSYLSRAAWNAPLNDKEANERASIFLRGQASAFNGTGQIWAPRYRQATFGAFLTDKPEAKQALDLAYSDVEAGFDHFLSDITPDRPIVLVGHSQGALHLIRLLREKIAGKPLADRIAAAYVIGWPISKTTDIAALGLKECETSNQSNCILSWQSFAEPADPELIVKAYDATTGFNGHSRANTPMICTNPLTGTAGGIAGADMNLGTLISDEKMKTGSLTKGAVPARCDSRGFLLIGDPPELGPYVLPGNNYHVYDFSLFWANIRLDVERRLASWKGA